jgi:hypothetical protein
MNMKKKKKQDAVISSEVVFWGLVLLAVGMLVNASYATPSDGVYHNVLDVVWGAIADNVDPNYDPADFLRDINYASNASAGSTDGVDADTLDGLDSGDLASGSGSSKFYYTKSCTWVSYVDVDIHSDTFDDWPFVNGEFWPRDKDPPCTDNLGNFTEVVPACDGADIDRGVSCYIKGIEPMKAPYNYFPVAWVSDSPEPRYIETNSEDYPGRDFVTSGVCNRLCEAV